MNEEEEKFYVRGKKSVYRDVLGLCLGKLGNYEWSNLVTERQSAINVLRNLCDQFGDNDWEPNLNLADIIEKHLGKYLWESQKQNNTK